HQGLFPLGNFSESGKIGYGIEKIQIIGIGQNYVQKTLDHIEFFNFRNMLHQISTDRLTNLDGISFYNPEHRENNSSYIAFKILSGGLKFYRFKCDLV